MHEFTVGGRKFTSADQVKARLRQLDSKHEGRQLAGEDRSEWNDLNEVLETLDEVEARADRLRGLYRAGAGETPFIDGGSRSPAKKTTHATPADGAMRTIERHVQEGRLSSTAADRVDGVLRGGDAEFGVDAGYVEAAGAAAYESAFVKLLRFGQSAILRMTPEEQASVQQVNQAEEVRTALTVGSGPGGGFAIPISIDPTVTLSSSGVLNPIRALADVRTVSTRELRLVTSDGVVAQYQAEAAEALDNSPVLAQPDLIVNRATSFIPFSFEVGMDWTDLLHELGQMIQDSKDVLEATAFLTGSGTNQPVGMLTVGTTGALTTSQRIQSAGTAAIALGDVYALKQAIGSTRFQGDAQWLVHPTRLDSIFRLVASGSTVEPQIMPQGRSGPLLGRPAAELSTMATTTTTGSKWAVYGDFGRGYVIADRLGSQLDIVPHLFSPANQRPTGQSGAFAIWWNDGRVNAANALRYAETA
jgi:HK97 family phage major capsid protein